MKAILRIALVVLVGLLILGLIVPTGYWLLSRVWGWGFDKNERTSSTEVFECPDCVCPTEVTPRTEVSDNCLFDAGQLDLPKDVANYVCDGKWGEVSLQLQSGKSVPFGTFTMDAEHRVWILFDFTVPPTANYSFSYENSERNLLKAPFLVGSELGWKGEERVPFTVCHDFQGECFLPENIVAELFPTQ